MIFYDTNLIADLIWTERKRLYEESGIEYLPESDLVKIKVEIYERFKAHLKKYGAEIAGKVFEELERGLEDEA